MSRLGLRVSDKPCARSRCKRPGIEAAGRPVLCLKHHQSYGTGRAKLERRVRVAGEKRAFGSGWEAERGKELRVLEEAGAITGLEFQVSFALRLENGVCVVDPTMKSAQYYPAAVPRSKKGKLIERYVADAVYREIGFKGIRFKTGELAWTVEDSKAGYMSTEFRQKRTWMLEGYGIRIHENHKPRR
jgi:hypothetical protein